MATAPERGMNPAFQAAPQLRPIFKEESLMTTPTIKMNTALLTVAHLLAQYRNVDRRVSVLGADSRPLAPHSLTRVAPAPCTPFASGNVLCRWQALIRGRSHPIRFANGAGSCTLFVRWNVLCRRRALIRGRSHPIRFANGTWLAAHSATWLAAHRPPPCAV